ncbi:MAG: PAS domain-containing protein, partial [Planctomycetes bacterium]|nr:PAS domain-containing protein [Planctomycetota bacterium]
MCTPTQCRYLSQGSNLLVAVAPDGTIRAIDPRHATILGHDTSDLSGKPLAALVPPDQHGHLARILARCETTPAVWDHLTFLASDGQPEPMLCCFQRFVGTDIPQKSVLVTGLRLEAVESDLRAEAAAVLGQLAYR